MKKLFVLFALAIVATASATTPKLCRVTISHPSGDTVYARPYSLTGTVDNMGVYSATDSVMILPADEYIIYGRTGRIIVRIERDARIAMP